MKWIKSWVESVPSPTHPERNEDNLWIAASNCAAAVIDGMGGYRRQTATGMIGGEHASMLAAQVLAEKLDEWDGSHSLQESKRLLRDVIRAVNARIWDGLNWSGNIPKEENSEGKEVYELSVGAAMTLVALCDGGSRALMAQQGDTHGYALKEEMGLLQITEDQDLLLWEQLNGTLSAEEAAHISQAIDQFDGTDLRKRPGDQVMRYFFDKNIFGALGVDGECPETGWSVIKLDPGDRIALLSDGAYSNMSINELEGLLSFPHDPATVVVELAHQRSVLPRFPNPNDFSKPFNVRATPDDMTVLVMEVGYE
ncbi:MAG: PP2C family protein-serine/threonine phosphatase [Ardenticatenaceae bacterium]